MRAGAERLRRDVERRDVGQNEIRHVRVQDHVGQRQARRPRRHQHRARERAESVLGAGHHGHPEEPVRVPHGADGQRCARGAVPPAAWAAQGQRFLCVEVFVRRQRADRPEKHGDRRVLPSRRRAALLQVHRRHRAVRDGKRSGVPRAGAVRSRAVPVCVRRAVPGRGLSVRIRIRRYLPKSADGHRQPWHEPRAQRRGGFDAALLYTRGRERERAGAAGHGETAGARGRKPRAGQHPPDRLQRAARKLHQRLVDDGQRAARDQRKHGHGGRQRDLRRDGGERHCRAAGGKRQGQPGQHAGSIPCIQQDCVSVHRADPAVLRSAEILPDRGRAGHGAVRVLQQPGAAAAGAGHGLRRGHGDAAAGVRYQGQRAEEERIHPREPERAGAAVFPDGLLQSADDGPGAGVPGHDGL